MECGHKRASRLAVSRPVWSWTSSILTPQSIARGENHRVLFAWDKLPGTAGGALILQNLDEDSRRSADFTAP